jgi:hypothetical protein
MIAVVRSLLVAIAALLASVPALALETDYVARWEDGQRMFVPADVVPAARRYSNGEQLFEAPLRWVRSLSLQHDVAITFEGNSVTLPAGTQLPLASFSTKAAPGTLRSAFCTRFGIVNTASKFINDRWLFKTPFDAKNKLLCLEDTDRDGMLDRSFVLTTQSFLGRPDIIYTGPVNHSAEAAAFLAPIDGGGDVVRFRVGRIGKTKAWIRIELTIQGNMMMFNRFQSGGYDLYSLTTFPGVGANLDLLGVDVRLQSLDPIGKTVEFKFAPVPGASPVMIPNWVSSY